MVVSPRGHEPGDAPTSVVRAPNKVRPLSFLNIDNTLISTLVAIPLGQVSSAVVAMFNKNKKHLKRVDSLRSMSLILTGTMVGN